MFIIVYLFLWFPALMSQRIIQDIPRWDRPDGLIDGLRRCGGSVAHSMRCLRNAYETLKRFSGSGAKPWPTKTTESVIQ